MSGEVQMTLCLTPEEYRDLAEAYGHQDCGMLTADCKRRLLDEARRILAYDRICDGQRNYAQAMDAILETDVAGEASAVRRTASTQAEGGSPLVDAPDGRGNNGGAVRPPTSTKAG